MPKALNDSLLTDFASRLVTWQRAHGRHDLPWQENRDPYRVWLSEVMLQQTQVSTVISYYLRFLQAFPTVTDLANADPDQVMALWTGLGYYSRARNLQRCAQQVVSDWGMQFPRRSADLVTLAGIGPSTAAAIASICFNERVAIFDGNVQRVLARYLAFEGDVSQTTAVRELRTWAGHALPEAEHMPTYTQAIMDLGATVCTPRQPRCQVCPVEKDCQANMQGRVSELPIKTRKLKRQSQSWWLLVLRHPQKGLWLERRPEKGIWAGLYCFPVFGSREELLATLDPTAAANLRERPARLHVLTHRDLHLHVCELTTGAAPSHSNAGQWFDGDQAIGLGLPKPVLDYLNSVPGDA